MHEDRCVKRYVWTRSELPARGIGASTFAGMRLAGELHRLLPGIYCTRVPTTMDRCHAVSLWRPGAVMSHGTAGWLHGLLEEPSVIEAYVRELPAEPTPAWLHLRVPEYGIYDDAGAFGADVMQPTRSRPVRNSRA